MESADPKKSSEVKDQSKHRQQSWRGINWQEIEREELQVCLKNMVLLT